MSNDSERKATDILIALEQKIDNLTKLMYNIDLSNKIILDKFSKLNSTSQFELNNNDKQELHNKPSVSQQNIINAVAVSESIPTKVESNKIDIVQAVQEEPKKIIVKSSQDKKPETAKTDKKVPVIQRVTDNNGKDLFMADVSILDENNDLVEKIKTNATGKWQVQLRPGKYIIDIVKTDNVTKNKLQSVQEIIVPEINEPYKLPVAVIKR